MKLFVNELYGLTYQGEGSSVGTLCAFIRLSYCNQKCVFCDSFHTWAFEEDDLTNHIKHKIPVNKEDEVIEMTIGEILPFFIEKNPPMIIITGGEPMIQFRKLLHLIPAFAQHVPALTKIEIETAGTIFSPELTDFQYVHFNVSPKLENSGNSLEVRYKPHILRMFNTQAQAIFKFVVSQESDFMEIEDIINQVGIPKHKVYIMAEGELAEEQIEKMKWLVPLSLEKNYNFSPRLHTLIWGNKRKV